MIHVAKGAGLLASVIGLRLNSSKTKKKKPHLGEGVRVFVHSGENKLEFDARQRETDEMAHAQKVFKA